MSAIGPVGAGHFFLNGSGSHILLSLMASRNSEWGEDLIVGKASGTIFAIVGRQHG